ncbi:tapasin-related protein-like [Cheilinus undulatus]|uniref:tapasin-related protein-like n=1 Tax=Cheilinus undulatus TaxID=241271 RepID=UPI001BD430F7|nr:tapasin-related protein-like [Cheilinus undulatus]
MFLISRLLFYLILCTGAQCIQQVTWLPCLFMDEHVSFNNESHLETKLIRREALLQFGQKGDTSVNPQVVTFLVTGSKLDLQRYIKAVEAAEVECELHRFSTPGIHVPWPVKGEEKYSRWFTSTLRHTKGLFTVTGFLRQPSDQPPSGQQDYFSWPEIKDGEMVTTTVVLVTETRTPTVKARLGSEQKLHCQYAVDHKAPHITVEWYLYRQGQREELFSYNSHTGQTKGSGVQLKSLTGGDASLTIPKAEIGFEGKYFCSVSVNPLFTSMDVLLHIEEPPRVSLNVEPSFSLVEGELEKILCMAENFYPLDVDIVWHSEHLPASGQRVGRSLSKIPHAAQKSSHKKNKDKTYSLSSFFYLKASYRDSGRQFTCTVSHPSLKEPIVKSFILTVRGPNFWVMFVIVDLFLLIVCYKVMPRYLCKGKRRSMQTAY